MHEALTIFPTLLVILAGILLNRHDVKELGTRLESRIDKLETHFESRIDHLETHFESRIDKLETDLNQRVDKLEARFDHRLDKLEADMNNFYAVTGRLDGRLDELSRNR